MSTDPFDTVLDEALSVAYTVAVADESLRTLLGADSNNTKIYNHVPQGKSLEDIPFVYMALIPVEDWSTKTERGWRAELKCEVYSAQHGDNQSLNILSALRAIFHARPLTLTKGKCVDLYLTSGDQVPEPDGQSKHGTIRFTLLIEEL